MSGCIIASYGFQRQGKTLICYLLAEYFRSQGIEVYSNMYVPGWITIDALSDVPFSFKPRVLLLDEAYYFLDSRSWEKNKEVSIFFTTIGKQEILLMFTAISPDMVEKRIRGQVNYMFIAKRYEDDIFYNFWDIQRQYDTVLTVQDVPKLYPFLTYDTKQIPKKVNVKMDGFEDKVDQFYNIYNNRQKQKIKL